MSDSRNSLSRNLQEILEAANGQPITLERIFRGVGDKAFGVLLAILSLPSALPLPAPGYSTPFGILLAILSLQMMTFRETPLLPKFAMRHEFSHERARKFFHAAIGFLRRIEWIIHPRMKWIGKPAGRAALGWLTLIMSCLMILPIPFTNTFPAMIIFLIGVGLTEDDGAFALLSFLFGILAVGFYAFVFYLLFTVGLEGVLQLKNWVKSLLGR